MWWWSTAAPAMHAHEDRCRKNAALCRFCPWWPWPLTFDPEIRTRGRDFCTAHLTAKFHHPMFNPSEVIVLTNKQTSRWVFTARLRPHFRTPPVRNAPERGPWRWTGAASPGTGGCLSCPLSAACTPVHARATRSNCSALRRHSETTPLCLSRGFMCNYCMQLF